MTARPTTRGHGGGAPRVLLAALSGLLAGALGAGWSLGADTASAHAVLLSVTPADGATVTQAPVAVRLVFAEPIQGRFATVAVATPDGRRVDHGSPSIRDATVTEALAPLPVAGRYTVAYRVVSADGHPVSAQLSFTYLPPAGVVPAVHAAPDAPGAAVPADSDESWLRTHALHVAGAAILLVGGGAVIWREQRAARRG